jgi:oligosaccharide 4-alpha-D-glucosyltransferase
MRFPDCLASARGSCLRALLLLALLLPAAAPALQGEPRLAPPAALLGGGGISARLTAVDGETLRLTAWLDGAPEAPLPFRIELPPAAAVASSKEGLRAAGFVLQQEKGGPLRLSLGGQRVLQLDLERDGERLLARLAFEGAKAFHGLGQIGPALAFRDEKLTLRHEPKYGDQTYLYLPFFFSDSGVAVSWNAASGDRLELSRGSSAVLGSATGRLDLYLFASADPRALVARQYRLSGARSLLPRWAYGYIQSKYGYRNDAEVRRVASAFPRFGLPLSALVLDHYWFDKFGDLDWDKRSFPDPEGLARWLEQQGVRLVTISEPFIRKDSKLYAPLLAKGGLALDGQGKPVVWSDWWDFNSGAGGSVIDPGSGGARELLVERYAQLAKGGVGGFWIDLGEPERVPDGARFGRYGEAAYHDFFNLAWAGLVRAGWEQARPGKRPFILSRSGFTGISGLGVATWSGDVPATWEGLRDQPPLGLSASISGLPFWGSDVGGFVSPLGELVPPDPELYLRWQQFGSFSPVHRAHGAGAREPWIYGPEWLGHVKLALERRMQLLPYVYSTAYQVWSEGLPMMRPLFFAAPGDAGLHGVDDEYLFGDALLFAPVTSPLSREAEKRVVLPPGVWLDAFTGERVRGPTAVRVKLTLDTFPLFYKEGAIVPVEREGQQLLQLVPGPGESRFTVFSDDGESEGYRKGEGERLRVTLTPAELRFEGAERARELGLLFPKDAVPAALAQKAQPFDALWVRVPVSLGQGATRIALQ